MTLKTIGWDDLGPFYLAFSRAVRKLLDLCHEYEIEHTAPVVDVNLGGHHAMPSDHPPTGIHSASRPPPHAVGGAGGGFPAAMRVGDLDMM